MKKCLKPISILIALCLMLAVSAGVYADDTQVSTFTGTPAQLNLTLLLAMAQNEVNGEKILTDDKTTSDDTYTIQIKCTNVEPSEIDGWKTDTQPSVSDIIWSDSESSTIKVNTNATATGKDGTYTFKLDLNPDTENEVILSNLAKIDYPGIYTFEITQTEVSNNHLVASSDTHTVKAYVTYGKDKDGNIDTTALDISYVEYDPVQQTDESKPNGNITFLYQLTPATTYDLTLTKLVTGNMGDLTKDFTFTVKLEGQAANGIYNVTDSLITDTSTTVDGRKTQNPNTIQSNGTFLIRNGETITIKGLPVDATYSIEESVPTGYTNTDISASDNTKDEKDNPLAAKITKPNVSGTILGAQNLTYTNNATMAPATAVVLDSLPYVFVGVMIVAAIALFVSRRKTQQDDEF